MFRQWLEYKYSGSLTLLCDAHALLVIVVCVVIMIEILGNTKSYKTSKGIIKVFQIRKNTIIIIVGHLHKTNVITTFIYN